MIIKAISLWQPWATAWVIGLKKAETRHWAPVTLCDNQVRGYGGALGVHAAKTERDPNTGESLREWFEARLAHCERSRVAFATVGVKRWADLPRGSMIGACWLDDVRWSQSCKPDDLEKSWGNYSPNRQIWFPAQMTRLPTPVPCVGRQALFNWEVPPDVFALPQFQNAIAEPPF